MNDFIKEEIKDSGKGWLLMQPPLFSGVLVMPKYENPAKKESEFFAGFFVLLVQIIFCFS